MPVYRLQMPPLHAGQAQVWRDGARFQALACGRRWGKTRYGVARCIDTAARRGRAWWVAPSYPVATVGWRLARRLAGQIPGAEVRLAERTITLPGGGEVRVRSADHPDSLRGDALDGLVIDECAFVAEEAWTEALRPALADRRGWALFISTPAGRNWFWRLWMGAADLPDWSAWRFTSYDNPHIDPAEIDQARGQMPDMVFRQEFLAEFVEEAGVFRGVREAATAEAQSGPVDGHRYVVGVDWARLNDYTVFAVVDVTTRELVFVDRFNQLDYAMQLARLQALHQKWRPVEIVAETNSMGDPLVEEMGRRGLPVRGFTTSNATKAAAVEALMLAFEQGEIRIVADEAVIGELQAYEATRLPSGLVRYGAPAGMHDDTVMALALAWDGARNAAPVRVVQRRL